MTILSSHQFH